jgi:hypothetical protein
MSTENLGSWFCRYISAVLCFESYILEVLYNALKPFCGRDLLEIWLYHHLRKQNNIDRLLHSPLLNNGAAVCCMQEAIKNKGGYEKRLGLYNVRHDLYILLYVLL